MKAMADIASRLRVYHAGQLGDLADFGSNPGALAGRTYVPAGRSSKAPLVVVLHGCTQTAAAYDHGAGWSDVADRFGFAVLFPEQQRANNANLCFNWFDPGDTRRGGGEALSIRQMVAAMIERHDLDPGRVFITGLSAGGAMASVMLATYPEVFAGGAIIAGLPYGSATSLPQALDRMRGHGGPDDAGLAASVRRASSHEGPWPTIAVWHGTADATVDSVNADAIVAQWCGVHDMDLRPSVTDRVDGYPHRAWLDADGRTMIEDYRITGMGHGTPLDTQAGEGCGAAGPYMLEARISSTLRIAQSWGIADAQQHAPQRSTGVVPLERTTAVMPAGIGSMIEDALRTAGLMR